MTSSMMLKFLSGSIMIQQARLFTVNTCSWGKHWDIKWRKERGRKVIRVQLPDFDEQREDQKLSLEEIRAKLKEKGICPPRRWNEKPMHISCSGDIMDPFLPPEGDGKISPVSGPGVKQVYDVMSKKGKSYMAVRKIRNIDYDFDVPTVAQKAYENYIEVQKAMTEKNEDILHDLVTEKAYPEMMEHVKNKTIKWRLIQSLEPPRIVHIRCEEMISKETLFAQATVRMHTQQTLAIYDRFGRLMHGSEDIVKDVLEYIVFEKQITNFYGTWRIHGKIIPDWMPPRDPVQKTYLQPDIDKEFPEPPQKQQQKQITESSSEANPPLAVA